MKEKYIYIALGVVALAATYYILRKRGFFRKSTAAEQDGQPLDLTSPQMQGTAVTRLQTELARLYATNAIQSNPGPIDGIYGPLTKAAHDEAMNLFGIKGRCLKCFLEKVPS